MRKLALASAVLAVAGCRGSVSEKPPIYPELVLDMDFQAKYQAQGESAYFADGRSMRAPVEGTVARGSLKDDEGFYRGTLNGQFLGKAPLDKVKAALHVDTFDKVLDRGHERFNIYCAPCHDQSGSGKGLVAADPVTKPARYPNVPNLYGPNALGIGDGEIFNYISNGVRTMPAYGHQIPEADRWAIVTWVRVLQRSQHAQLTDVPEQKRGNIEAEDAK